jgi:hypothetical protein
MLIISEIWNQFKLAKEVNVDGARQQNGVPGRTIVLRRWKAIDFFCLSRSRWTVASAAPREESDLECKTC